MSFCISIARIDLLHKIRLEISLGLTYYIRLEISLGLTYYIR